MVRKLNKTIAECNTAYGRGRTDTESHLKAAVDQVFTAIDPMALDHTCTDMVRSSDDPGKEHLIKRIDSRKGILALD